MEDQKFYEIAFLVKNPNEERAVLDLIEQYKGSVVSKSQLQETKLAYPIKKHSSAYFGYVQFGLLPESLEKLSQSLKLNQAVLRYLTVVAKDSKKAPEKNKSIGAAAAAPTTSVSKPVLTNEALEQKLEEILK